MSTLANVSTSLVENDFVYDEREFVYRKEAANGEFIEVAVEELYNSVEITRYNKNGTQISREDIALKNNIAYNRVLQIIS